MPSLVIMQSQSVVPGSCGNDILLTLTIGNSPVCGTFTEAVTITGAVPGQFDIISSDLSYSGQNVNHVIQPNTLPNPPGSNVYTLRIRPKYCSSINPLNLILNVSVPNGYGLGTGTCSEIITPPAAYLPTNAADFKFFVTPEVPCVQIVKTTSTPNIQPGGTAVFQVSVRNTGNLPAANVVVTDILPPGLTVLSTPPNTVVSNGVATTTLSTLNGGTVQNLTYTFTHTATICGSSGVFENCATAYFPACNATTAPSCAQVAVGMQGVTMVQVTGEMGTLLNGAWTVPIGLPASGGNTPLVIDFATGSILHINSPTYIFPPNTVFRMREGARIVVDGGKYLNIQNNSHLFSCDTLWKGIRLEQNSRFRMTGSILEDAAYGVDIADDSPYLYLIDNTFQNNYIGIRAAAGSTGGHTVTSVLISN